MNQPATNEPDATPQTAVIPTLHITAESIPTAHFRATKAVWEQGRAIRTQYDRKNRQGEFIDPPSKDAKVLVEIANPFNQPRYPAVSYCEIGKYIAEILGVKDHLVVPYQELKDGLASGALDTKWPYTYHQRLFAYPLPDGSTIDQVELMLERLVESPYTRRAVASTAVPDIDCHLPEDMPCLREIQLRCTENEEGVMFLHMDTKWRSRDLYKAWPDNILGLTFMQALLARQLGEKMKRQVLVGGYSDYASSLHLYGQDLNERGVDKYISRGERQALASAYDSEVAAEIFLIPHLEELAVEEYWKFPEETKEEIRRLINDQKAERYLA